MISISKSYSFDAAHKLDLPECTVEENLAMFGKCNRLHGHTYTLTVEVSGRIDDKTGMILNYFDLDKIVKPIVDGRLDHEFMNEVFPEVLTTAENMVQIISRWLIVEFNYAQPEELPSLRYILESLTLSETPKTTAKWSR